MKRVLLFGMIAVAVAVAGGYVIFRQHFSWKPTEPSSLGQPGRLQVVASFYPLYFLSERIAGGRADVKNIVPAGAEPHDYEPTAQDMALLEKSGLVVLNGGGLEAWEGDLRKNIGGNARIIVAGEGLTNREMTGEEGGQLTTDPHIWVDPALAKKMTENIERGFELADPENAAYYRKNTDQLLEDLSRIDDAYRIRLESCTEKNIITSHAAFGYLAAEYGFNQVPIAGLSPDAEPSPAKLADIAKFARENNVRYIFFESLASPKLSQTIASEIGAETLVLNPIEGLSPDEESEGKDYLSILSENLKNLQMALQCNTR